MLVSPSSAVTAECDGDYTVLNDEGEAEFHADTDYVIEPEVLDGGVVETDSVEVDEYELSDDGIMFHEDAVQEEFTVDVNQTNDSVTISLPDDTISDHSQVVGIPTYALTGIEDAVQVDHYTDDGEFIESYIQYPEIIDGYAYVQVELSTVTIYPALNRIKNYSFEMGTSGGVPYNWTLDTGTVTVLSAPYVAHGNYCLKFVGTGATYPAILSQWNGISGSPLARRYKTVSAWINITGMTTGTVTIDLYNTSYGADSTGIVMTGNTNGWQYVTSAAEYTNGNVVRIFGTSINSGAVVLIDGVSENYNYAAVSADETYDSNYLYQNFSMTFPVATTGTATQWISSTFSQYPLEKHGKCTVTATIDGTTRPSEIVGNTVFIDASTSGTGAHTVTIRVNYNRKPVAVSPPTGGSYTLSGIGYGAYLFAWDWTNTTNKLEIATDSGFSNIIVSDTVTSDTTRGGITHGNSSYVAMPAGNFWWRVSSYDQQFGTWNTSTTSTLTLTTPLIAGKGVTGMVYKGSEYIPVSGATVTVYNDTWSKVVTTGVSGVYNVTITPSTDSKNDSTYYVAVGADGYQSVLSSYPFNITSPSGYLSIVNVQLVEEADQFQPIDARFILLKRGNSWTNVWSNLFPEKCANAEYSVYEEYGTTAIKTGTSDTTGSFVLEDINPGVKYRIVVTYNGVTTTNDVYVYATQDVYKIYIGARTGEAAQASDNITMSVTKTLVNSTAWNITATSVDTSYASTGVFYYFGEWNKDGQFVTLHSDYVVPTDGTAVSSYTVLNPSSKTYTVRMITQHPTFGDVEQWFTVEFPATNIPFYGSVVLAWGGLFLLIIIALMFGKADANAGAILTVGMYYFMYYIGIYDGFGAAKLAIMNTGAGLAGFFALYSYVMSKKQEAGA